MRVSHNYIKPTSKSTQKTYDPDCRTNFNLIIVTTLLDVTLSLELYQKQCKPLKCSFIFSVQCYGLILPKPYSQQWPPIIDTHKKNNGDS